MCCFPKQSTVGVLNAFAGPLLMAKDPKASAVGEKNAKLIQIEYAISATAWGLRWCNLMFDNHLQVYKVSDVVRQARHVSTKHTVEGL